MGQTGSVLGEFLMAPERVPRLIARAVLELLVASSKGRKFNEETDTGTVPLLQVRRVRVEMDTSVN
jgi:hypothetical protein